jgi:hypothetical protein
MFFSFALRGGYRRSEYFSATPKRLFGSLKASYCIIQKNLMQVKKL